MKQGPNTIRQSLSSEFELNKFIVLAVITVCGVTSMWGYKYVGLQVCGVTSMWGYKYVELQVMAESIAGVGCSSLYPVQCDSTKSHNSASKQWFIDVRSRKHRNRYVTPSS